ncbi:hypothetical protein [Bordetella phage CN2]|uniref:Uncharacterized protein n=1 Tax=Bordetella phage CN2 TaxID=1916124 RepID=A0A2D0W9C4_9CAUD|nr:hypothetical protein HOS30_gp36 [Bordetella phage CN2]APL99254.1 hypothetical protein [Bordetella phage CN2]
MSTQLVERTGPGYNYTLTRFSGGAERGVCVQITDSNGYVQLTKQGAAELAADLSRQFLELDPQYPLDELVNALKSDAVERERRLAAEARENAARIEGELRAVQRELKETRERTAKELEHARERVLVAERNLARAQGYIDRVTEGEPPLPGVRNEVHERVGSVGVSYINGPEPRGPKLDLGVNVCDTDGFGLRR